MKSQCEIPADLARSKAALERAINRGRSAKWQLRLWSQFVKTRDGHRCLCCDSCDNIQSHHIVRRTRFPAAALDTGNGITLCRACHALVHAEFNRKPNPALPMSAAQGDDQDEWSFLFGLLVDDANDQGLAHDDYYRVSDALLVFSVDCQGYAALSEALATGEISQVRFMHEIWRAMPEKFYGDLGTAIGREIIAARLTTHR